MHRWPIAGLTSDYSAKHVVGSSNTVRLERIWKRHPRNGFHKGMLVGMTAAGMRHGEWIWRISKDKEKGAER